MGFLLGRTKPIYIGQSKKMLEQYLSSVSSFETFESFGETIGVREVQRDLRFLIDEFCMRKDEELRLFVHNCVAIISANYGARGTIEDGYNSISGLHFQTQAIKVRYAKIPKIRDAVVRLSLAALQSYNKSPYFEQIMARVQEEARRQLGEQ